MSAAVLAFPPPATPEREANAVRPAAFRRGRVVATKFTAYAPQRGHQFLTQFGPPTVTAVAEILQRLDREPHQVRAEGQAMGDIAVFGCKPGETRWPLAFVFEGLSEADFNAALDVLSGQAWRPDGGRRA